jgi:hypothetical protein
MVFVEKQDINRSFENASYRWKCSFSLTDDRGINLEYLTEVNYKMERKLIYLSLISLDVLVYSDFYNSAFRSG